VLMNAQNLSFSVCFVCVCSSWGRYNVTVPVNAKATLFIPTNSSVSAACVHESGGMVGATFVAMTNSTSEPPVPVALFEVGSGHYEFVSEYIG
jgi:hypothetical protein